MTTWKEVLADVIDPEIAREIDVFETQIELKKQGKVDDRLFSETRLRRGTYGQRYDNGQRHDGLVTRQLQYPSGSLTKGPETILDAPCMQRIKIPFGGLNSAQIETLADLAEEYSDGICHVTTRQDIQLHFVHIDDTPSLMRRLAAVGITTREACGNSVRNVTACPLAGVCRDETFDVTRPAEAIARFLLGHPDTQDFGRKFKIAFSGCGQNACGLVSLHDLGFIARKRVENGREVRGYETYVGGGLGTVPYKAKLFSDFVPEAEILPLAQAISRVFARLGEKRNRARARVKFLVNNLGIDEFRKLVLEERSRLTPDSRWIAWIENGAEPVRDPRVGGDVDPTPIPPGFDEWARTNVYPQRQDGYSVVTVTVPLGDLTSRQMRDLAVIARRYARDDVRTTVEQNIVLRWVRNEDLGPVFAALWAAKLAMPGASTIVDVVACPGTDTCKLGIASSRGLANELSMRLAAQQVQMDEAIRALHIKISGCFNSCGQHHICDLGFYGVSRKVGGTTVPHFQVMLGGQWEDNAGAYGLAIGAVPSKRVPDFVSRITAKYLGERQGMETFHSWVTRIGKKALREVVDEFTSVPPYSEDRSYYSDWRDPREFSVADMGMGECAGEVVSRIDFDLQEAERKVFEAQLLLENGDFEAADETAYAGMLEAARGLVRLQLPDVAADPDVIVDEFSERFYESRIFWDTYAGGKFAQYLFHRHQDKNHVYSDESAHHLVEEAQLFIEAAHACHARILEKPPLDPAAGLRPTD